MDAMKFLRNDRGGDRGTAAVQDSLADRHGGDRETAAVQDSLADRHGGDRETAVQRVKPAPLSSILRRFSVLGSRFSDLATPTLDDAYKIWLERK
jgi:hypothetical protein